MRVLFVMGSQLGWETVFQNWKPVIEARPDLVVPTWLRARHLLKWTDRAPFAPSSQEVKAYLAELARAAETRWPSACLFAPHAHATAHTELFERVPTYVVLDATHKQLESMSRHYPMHTSRVRALRWLKHARQGRMLRSVAGVLATSAWAKQSLIVDYGVEPSRVHVVCLGVDTALWSREAPSRGGDGRVRALFIGGDFERKGGDMLLRWARETQRTGWAIDVVTRKPIPDTPGVQWHEAQANSPELLALARRADFFALPTRGDCLPNAAMEAAAAGLPVLISDVGGCAECVIDGETGYVFRAGDFAAFAERMDALIDSAALRARMSAGAQALARERFDVRRAVGRVMTIVTGAPFDAG
jgi:glycosyltransferase involved in cell wall biosynthesis